MTDDEILTRFGARYWEPGQAGMYRAAPDNLYDYACFIGPYTIDLGRGDSIFMLSSDKRTVSRHRGSDGSTAVSSDHFAVLIRGYMADSMTRRIDEGSTVLPYVNGCSTKQLFPPERAGDPTFQQLIIPPFSAEQAHHIHSTVRAVYVLAGRGVSKVGMEGREVATELKPGMTCVLEPMCPHHFETPQGEPLTVLPVHVWSSTGSAEFSHPMFNGTHLMNQGD